MDARSLRIFIRRLLGSFQHDTLICAEEDKKRKSIVAYIATITTFYLHNNPQYHLDITKIVTKISKDILDYFFLCWM